MERVQPTAKRLLEYDALHRRLWIGGQRLHHGATGLLVAGTACVGLVTAPVRGAQSLRTLAMMAAAGGALMAHDWEDRSIWFELGHGSQR